MIVAITHRIDYLDHKKRSYTNLDYITWLLRHNFSVITIHDTASIDKITEIADLLIIAGGYDMDPSLSHLPYDENYTKYDKSIDILDLCALKKFHEIKKPVLGICRGMQLMNIYFKGTLYSDIPNHLNISHRVIFKKNGILYPYYKNIKTTNSYHHQAIKKLSPLLHIEAISIDGIIEAFSYEDYMIGVQWHPELMKEDPLLLYFLQYLKNISKENTPT